MSKIIPILAGLAGTLMLLSCSGGAPGALTGSDANSIPTMPFTSLQGEGDLYGSNIDNTSGQAANHYLWGFFLIYFDPQKDLIEVVPVRQLETHWNVLKWLEKGPCTNCVSVVGMTPGPDDTMLFDVKIDHPFDVANLTGFDVRGIAMFAGSHTFPLSSLTTPDRVQGDGELINADGYTTLYNSGTIGSGPNGLQGYIKGKFASLALPDAKLNGYMRHVSSGSSNTRNGFYAGDSVIATYQLDMPDSAFGYAVDASWAPPTVKPVTDPMSDFPPEANCFEPYKVEVDSAPVYLGLNTQGGSNTLTIRIFDWQGKDSHQAPQIECPELFDGLASAAWSSDGTGYSEWSAVVTNEKLAAAGEYKCLIKVVDDENAGSPAYLDLTAYQVVALTVVQWVDLPPVVIPGSDSLLVALDQPLHFFDNGSYDPDGGSITLYEWDWNNDGTFDETGADLDHTFATAGDATVVLRATDNENTTGEASLMIHVDTPPIPVVTPDWVDSSFGTPIDFSGSGSTDTDGTIVKYEWDFDWDYVNFVPTAEGMDIEYTWAQPGKYLVNLRVTDDDGITAMLPTAVTVVLTGPGSTLTWGGIDNDEVADMDMDPDGNVYLTGSFSGTVDLDPGPGAAEYTANGSNDMFACKFDQSGALVWAVAWGGPDKERTKGISVSEPYEGDPSVYLTGYFQGTVDFDPGPGVFELTSNTYSIDAFAMKLDKDGNFQYALSWGGLDSDEGMDIGASNWFGVEEFTVAGVFRDSVDLDPGPGTQIFDSSGQFDISLSRFAADGSTTWVKGMGGSGNDSVRVIETKQSSSFLIGGYFSTTMGFDPISGGVLHSSAGGYDAFIASYAYNDCSHQFSYTWGGPGDDGVYDLKEGLLGVYSTGFFEAGADFNPGVGVDVLPNDGGTDVFLSIIDPWAGYLGAFAWGGSGNDYGSGVDILWGPFASSDSVYVTGIFFDTVNFDPTGGLDFRTSNGSSDVFVTRYSDGSLYHGTVTFGGTLDDYGVRVNTSYCSYNIYVAGAFSDVVNFDITGGTDNRTSSGSTDFFLMNFPYDVL